MPYHQTSGNLPPPPLSPLGKGGLNPPPLRRPPRGAPPDGGAPGRLLPLYGGNSSLQLPFSLKKVTVRKSNFPRPSLRGSAGGTTKKTPSFSRRFFRQRFPKITNKVCNSGLQPPPPSPPRAPPIHARCVYGGVWGGSGGGSYPNLGVTRAVVVTSLFERGYYLFRVGVPRSSGEGVR